MRSCEVYSTKVTHSGRHAGTAEAYKLGLNLDHIRHLGRWVMGQMENFYAPKNPIIGAFYMAHFNENQEPYFIERDLLTPPLELQRLIFPWIEDNFAKDMPEYTPHWVDQCTREMQGVDPGKVTNDDIFWGKFQRQESAERSNALNSSSLIDRIEFLKLLVRMRRVILQDAVMFMQTEKDGISVTNPLLNSMPEIFASDMFRTYAQELIHRMETYRENALILDPQVRLNSKSLINSINSVAKQLSNITLDTSKIVEIVRIIPTQLKELLESQKEQFNQLRIALQQQGRTVQEQQELQERASREQERIAREEGERRKAEQEYLFHAQLAQDAFKRLHSVSYTSNTPSSIPIYPLPASFPCSVDLLRSPIQLQQPQDRQQEEEGQQPQQQLGEGAAPLPSSDLEFEGYIMRPDLKNGTLSVREAWNEYHDPIAKARNEDTKWPYTSRRKQYYNRRKRFIELLKRIALKEMKDIDEFVDSISEKYKNSTINAIDKALKEQEQRDNKGKARTTEEEEEGGDEVL
ncbi:hypothetical protein BGZ49_000877 [Haplosporangium sp. Z 27]|nr:hypothetical protein BGZ49_000877 [Haplosporangium sp. Z 27]